MQEHEIRRVGARKEEEEEKRKKTKLGNGKR